MTWKKGQKIPPEVIAKRVASMLKTKENHRSFSRLDSSMANIDRERFFGRKEAIEHYGQGQGYIEPDYDV